MRYPVTGQIPSGLFLLLYADEQAHVDGMLSSWVQQASFDPVMITIAIEKGRPYLQHFVEGKTFTLHPIPAEDRELFTRYAANFSQSLKNEKLDIHATHQVPLIEGMNAMICEVTKQIEVGTHQLVLATVIAEEQRNQLKPRVHIRSSALNY